MKAQTTLRAEIDALRAKLVSELTQLDVRECAVEARRGRPNIYRLGIYLRAADQVAEDVAKGSRPETAFAEAFNPTRPNHGIARRLGLALDVDRGRWLIS